MKSSIISKVNKVIEVDKNNFENANASKYYEAISIYENLVRKGLAIKRGNNSKNLNQSKNTTTFNNFI